MLDEARKLEAEVAEMRRQLLSKISLLGAYRPEVQQQQPPTPGGEAVWPVAVRELLESRLPIGRGHRDRLGASIANDRLDDYSLDLAEAGMLRDSFGIAKYGQQLQAHNGRDPWIDALQEALDGVAYLTQASMECDALSGRERKRRHSKALALRKLAVILAMEIQGEIEIQNRFAERNDV